MTTCSSSAALEIGEVRGGLPQGSTPSQRASLSRYLDFFNRQRPHSSLDRKTPDEAYFTLATLAAAA